MMLLEGGRAVDVTLDLEIVDFPVERVKILRRLRANCLGGSFERRGWRWGLNNILYNAYIGTGQQIELYSSGQTPHRCMRRERWC